MDAVQNLNKTYILTETTLEDCQKNFRLFLQNFKYGDQFKYVEEAKKLKENETSSLPISFNDLIESNSSLSNHVMLSFYKLYPQLCIATTNFINELFPGNTNTGKDYVCHFVDLPTLTSLRNLKTDSLGKLSRIRAQVIRSHSVHPELIIGAFKCSDCQNAIKNVEQQFIYTKPTICTNAQCMNRIKYEILLDESKFVDFQKVRVQETQEELPRGCIPRTLDIILRSDCVESAQPGDLSEFIGTLIVIPDISQISTPGTRTLESKPFKAPDGYDTGITGLKSLGVRELTYKIAFLATNVTAINNKYGQTNELNENQELTPESMEKVLTQCEIERVFAMSKDEKFVENVCTSLFPKIYGNDEVKRGLLLMLFGGAPKVTGEGTKLRGDINICLVGDPSTAKSQFLKRVAEFAPRAIYTSGKASSAAGLTAAVVRDQENGEFVIEAGALMLANNGICCIDEFDKMDVRDQVAIHEAMEQQTISITKAGVKATLNAKTSVLAAANPINGQYDRSKSLRQNIALSAPIMSRFDLFFVLVDECNEHVDYEIGRRIIESQNPKTPVYTDEEIHQYISFARCFQPKITREASELMTTEYKKMRDHEASGGNHSAWRITVRQLESLVRLSEATARMRFSDTVDVSDVVEAARLLTKSVIRIEQPDINFNSMQAAELVETEQVGHTIKADEYNKIATAIIAYLRKCDIDEVQVRRGELVEWYLHTIIDTITDEDVLEQKKQLLEMIIRRLIEKDNLLMVINPMDVEENVDEDNSIVCLHPNVAL